MTGKRNLRRILAWILLVAMGVNNFAGSLSSVQATGYEQETTQENGTDIISTENTKSEEVTSEEKNTSTQELNVVQYETETEDENVQDQKNADVQGQTKSQTEEVVPAVETASTEEIQQLYAEDGVIDGNLSIYPPTILMCDLTVNGDINIYGNLDLNGHTLTVNGNVKQYVNFSLNGTMIVHGSYNWIANTLDFANGRLYIDQDMDITESGNKTWKMIEENAYLFVGGDIILGFYDKLVTNITAGTIELQGNFIQNIYVNERTIRLPECDFVAEGTNRLLLSGSHQQTIYISKETSRFESIEVVTQGRESEDEGVYDFEEQVVSFSQYCNYESYESHGCRTNYGFTEIELTTLTEDSYVYGNGYLKEGVLDLDCYTLYIQGNFVQNGNVVLETGRLYIAGDYRIQSLAQKVDAVTYAGNSAIVDSTKNCYVYIMGDFVTESDADQRELLTNGKWYFYGNITQLGKNTHNFATDEKWKGYIQQGDNRKDQQILHYDNPVGNPLNAISLNDYSCKRIADNGIYILHRTGTAVGTIEADYYIDNTNKELLGYTGYNNDLVIVGELDLTSSVTLQTGVELYVRADLTIDSTYLYCNNIIIEQGTITIKNSNIHAENVTFTDGGTGRLCMEDEKATLTCNDLYIGSNVASGVLSAGKIIIQGNLTQKNTGTPNNFVTTGQMEVYLEGNSDSQIVHFDSMESEIENLYIYSGSGSFTIFDTEVNVHNLYDENHRIRENGLIGYTLEQDVTYSETIQFCGGVLDLNGHSMTVEKDLVLSGGTICLNGGSLIIKGSLRCQDMYEEDGELVYRAGCGKIIMNTENDYMQIEKDWYIQLQNTNMNDMSKGTICLSGNLVIQNEAKSYTQVGNRVIGGADLICNGNAEQTIEWSGKQGALYVKNLCLDSTHNLSGEVILYAEGTVSKEQKGKIQLRSIHVGGIDSIACEEIETDIYVERKSALQHDLTVKGTMYMNSITDINGHVLQADTVYLNAYMQMNHSEDTVHVTDFYIGSNYFAENCMTDGTIEIDGDFREISGNKGGFQPTGKHTVVFNHIKEGKVSINYINEKSKMNIVVLKGKLGGYSLNREKDEIANTVIMDYEDDEKPEAPENLTCPDKTCRTVTLSWDDAYDNMEIEKYIVYRDGVQIATTHNTAYLDMLLEYNTAYCYTVQAKDAKGNLSDKSALLKVVTNSDEEAPQKVKEPSVDADDSGVKIDFANCFKDNDSYIDYYVILRDGKEIARVPAQAYISYVDIDGTGDSKLVHSGNATYKDTTIDKRTIYQYAIYAVDMAENCSDKYEMEAITDPLPEAPKGFSVASENCYNYITFEKSGLRECYSYSIYRKTEGDNKYYELAKILNDQKESITYEDKRVAQGITYYYQVRPYNADGEKGENSKVLSIETSKDQVLPEITGVRYQIEGDIINEDMQIIVNASDNGMVKEIGAYYTKEGEEEKCTLKCQQSNLQGRYGEAKFLFETEHLQGVYVLHMYVKDQNDNYAETEKTVQVQCAGLAAVTGCKAEATENSVRLEWEAVEGAEKYRVERLYGGSYVSCGDTQNTTKTIHNLNSSEKYTFRVIAYDKDNIRGRDSDLIIVTTLEDTEIPVIETVNDNDTVYGEKTALWLSYSDNVEVDTIIAQYRREGEEEWKTVGETNGCGENGSVQITWDKTELVSGRYELRYQIADASGNLSEEVIRTAVIDKDPPLIKGFSLIPGNWSVTLQWNSIMEKDYAGYKLYRIHADGFKQLLDNGKNSNSYTEVISPKEEYTYQLCVWDAYDNMAYAQVQGTSINHDEVAPAVSDISDMLAGTQMVTRLAAPSCTDNDGIKEYIWNMGNGDIVTGENCEYIYEEAGEYEASLTVKDNSGNQTVKTFHITVADDIGMLEVKVTDKNGNIIKDADVVLRLNGSIYHSGLIPKTNSQGIVRYPLAEGSYQVAAFKDGYIPLANTVDMKTGTSQSIVFQLEHDSMIETDLSVDKLTYDEMVKNGIDVDANRTVYKYTLELKYEKTEMPTLEFDNRDENRKWSFRVPPDTNGTLNPIPSGDNKQEETTRTRNIQVEDISDDPEEPVFIVTQTEPVEISWLSNVYKVSITVCNKAGEVFGLQDTVVTLDIDDVPLQMADMKEGYDNDKEWIVKELAGGESATHSWYITGDQAGTYDIKAHIKAHIPFLEKVISQDVVSKNAVTITAGDGLHLYIYPEESAYIGERYYIQYKLKNESDENYYNVTTNFGSYDSPDMVMENVTLCTYEEDGRVEVNPNTIALPVKVFIPNQDGTDKKVIKVNGSKMTIKKLKPGEAVYGTSVKTFSAAGNTNEEYYKLVSEYVEEVNSNNTNVKVTVKPMKSHLSKTVKKETIKKKPDITGNDKKIEPHPIPDPIPHPIPEPTPSTDQLVKDPVNLMTGAFQSEHVLACAAGGTDVMDFRLAYNSLSAEAEGELGYGWSHNYEMRLERTGDFITLYLNPGSRLSFVESEDTRKLVSGRMEGNEIILEDDSFLERTYYQVGSDSQKYRITKNADGYIVKLGALKYQFDTEGNLAECVDEDGERILVEKTEQQLTITNAATGKMITAEYDKEGRIVAVTDPAGNSSKIIYKDGNLEKIIGKNGLVLTYVYDEEGHIVKGLDGEDVFVENTYDNEGRVLTQVANGNKADKTKFSYVTDSETGNLTVTMLNADGTTEKAVSDCYGQGLSYENAIGGMTTYLYNVNHDMTAYEKPDGTGQSYTYDQKGNITAVTDTTGKTYQYTYDEEGRATSIIGNDGMHVTYTYNENGQKKSISSSTGLKIEYTYNENGQVLTEKSNLGTLTYHYEKGMLTSLTDQKGNTYSFVYDANGNVIQYTDADGIVTDYKVDVSGRVLSEAVELKDGQKAVTIYTYDVYGNILSKMDPLGNTTTYTYDKDSHMTSETRPDGSTLQYTYDQNGNLIKITYPDGETMVEAIYDAAGNTLSLTDALKSVQSGTYSAGSQLLSLTQSNGGEVVYTYYDNGLLASKTDANGNTLSIRYDAAGRVSETSDADGNTTTYSYDANGNLEKIKDALGNSTDFGYNEYRKIVKQKDANGNVTTYDYDSLLNCVRVTDAEQGITEFAYDGIGQIIAMTKKGDKEDVTLSMTYDPLGNVTSITDGEGNVRRMEYDLNSNLTAVYDALGVKTAAYNYDALGNIVSVTDAEGNVTENSYDSFGNLVKQMNETTGEVSTYTYIGAKYLASSTDALGSTASMTYDSMGNVATLTNPNGGVTRYSYDLNSNLTDESIGQDYHVQYTYNAQNLTASKINSRDQKTIYDYDGLGRMVRQTDEAGIIEYAYDANGNVLTVTETVGEEVHTITRTYDGLNRVTSYEDGKGNKIGYTYDKIGNLVTLTYPNGKQVHYTYDKNGNIKTVTDWEQRITTYKYDANGRLIRTERPNGTIETREYDKMGRLIRILDHCGDNEINRQEYSYDVAGNITAVKNLAEVDVTSVTDINMTYDKNNRLLTYNGEEVIYDKDGNMVYGPLQGKMTNFVYDCRNRLIGAGDTAYEYDAENNRIAVTTAGKRTEYVINTQPELSQVLQSATTGKDTTYYFYGNGLTAQDDGKDYLTYHFNNVGSTMALTDDKGQKIASYEYSPYGQIISKEKERLVAFLYNGQYGVVTDESGLYYMRARYYNVDIKRFMNQDVLTGTLERISSLNRYAYVEGNPISYLDPFGLARSIYDEWHNYLQEMQKFYTYISVGVMALYVKTPYVGNIIGTAIGIDAILVASMDLGVCIGKAWEGIIENNYNKVEDSYEKMKEIIQSLYITITTMSIDSLYDKPIFGFLNDLIGVLEDLQEKYYGGK